MKVGAKRLNALVRGGKSKQTAEKNSSFNLMNVVNYFRKRDNQRYQDMTELDVDNTIQEKK